MKRLAFGVLVSASCLTLAAETPKAIPKQFLGTWSSSITSCRDRDHDHSFMTIEGLRLSFYESSGRVLAVATSGKRELALLVELKGEDNALLDALKFRLSEDNNTLTTVNGFQSGMTRVRCNAEGK